MNETILLNVSLPSFLEDYKHRVLSRVDLYEKSIVRVFRHIHHELAENPPVFDAVLTVFGLALVLVLVLRFLEWARSAKRSHPGPQLSTLRIELQKTRSELDAIRKLMNDKSHSQSQATHSKPLPVTQSPAYKKLSQQIAEQDNIIEKYEVCIESNNKLSEFFLEQFRLIFEEIKDMRKSMKSERKMNRSTIDELEDLGAGKLRQQSAVEPAKKKKKEKEEVGLLNGSVLEIVEEKGKVTPIKTLEVNSSLPTAPTSERKSPKSAETKRISPPIAKPTAVIKEKNQNPVDVVIQNSPPEKVIQQQKQSPVIPEQPKVQLPATPVNPPQTVTPTPPPPPPVFNKPKITPPPKGNRPPPPHGPSRPTPPSPQKSLQLKNESVIETKQQSKIVSQSQIKQAHHIEAVKETPKEALKQTHKQAPKPLQPKKVPEVTPQPKQIQTKQPEILQPKPQSLPTPPPRTLPPPPPGQRGPPRPPPPTRQMKAPAPPISKQQSIELPREVNEEQLNFPESAHTIVKEPEPVVPATNPVVPVVAPTPTPEPQQKPQETINTETPKEPIVQEKIEKPKFKPPPPPPTGARKPPPPPMRR